MSNDRECRADIAPEIEAPALSYRPPTPKTYRPKIGLIGCGGIAPYHLRAYRASGFEVAALCDQIRERAESLKETYYPAATVSTDYTELVERGDIDVLDVATHPAGRIEIIEAALSAGKHVLSQKPFVLDLAAGERLVRLAESKNLRLAVNQNGRWAPHFAYIREAIRACLLGDVSGVHLSVHWDHNWTADTPFNALRHLILCDFAVHWFDITRCFLEGAKPTRVYANVARSKNQRATPPLLANVVIEWDGAAASLAFHADTRFGAQDRTVVVGSAGCAISVGPDLNTQTVTITTAAGRATPSLEGDWFTNGFQGTMGELLCAIEEGREPYNSARHNLQSLAICFAAIESADTGRPVAPGEVAAVRP